MTSTETVAASCQMPTRTYPARRPARPPPDARAAVAWPARPDDPPRAGTRLARDSDTDGPATVALVHDRRRGPRGGVGTGRGSGPRRRPGPARARRRRGRDPDRPSARRAARPRASRASGSRARGAVLESLVPGDPRAEGDRRGGASRLARADPRVRRARARTARVAPPPPARAVDAGRAPLLRLPPVRRRAAPGRPRSGGSRRARRGSRRSSTCRSPRPTRG